MKYVSTATSLKEQFIEVVKLLFLIIIPDADCEDAMTTVYDELTRKLCITRIQEFISATKQDLAAKKGFASTVDVNLRTILLTNHTKHSTIGQM